MFEYKAKTCAKSDIIPILILLEKISYACGMFECKVSVKNKPAHKLYVDSMFGKHTETNILFAFLLKYSKF